KCFNCKQMSHFSRECRAQGGQNSNNYQKYKSKEAGNNGSDSKAMVVVDGSIDWDKQTDEGNTKPRSLENFGMIAGIKIESDADSESEVVSTDNAIPAGVSISAGNVAAVVVSPLSETEFALMGLSAAPVTCPFVVDDVIYSFFANHEIDQHLVYKDLDYMNQEEFEEYDLKHQMVMLSIKVHIFEKKHRRKIRFNGRENARFDKKLVKCFNCKQMSHFSRECRAQGGQNSNNYQKYKSKEAGNNGSDSKAMVVVDGSIDWDKQTDEGNTKPRSLENFGMIAGIKIESDADS
nr:hypothetical protein [Tanacetum cinerariifolium]